MSQAPPAPPVRTPQQRNIHQPFDVAKQAEFDFKKGPVFINEQSTPVHIFGPNKIAITVMPSYLVQKANGNGTFYVQGDFYARFADGRGGLVRFRSGVTPDAVEKRLLAMVAADGSIQTATPGTPPPDGFRATPGQVRLDPISANALFQGTRGADQNDVDALSKYIHERRQNPDNVILPPPLDQRFGDLARCIADGGIAVVGTLPESPASDNEEKKSITISEVKESPAIETKPAVVETPATRRK